MKMRISKPESGNKFYNTKSNGGYSTCIKGYPTDNCDVLANCVGYACGRFNEIIGSMKYPSLNCNAENFIERAQNTYGLEISSVPTLGGIMVFQKGATLNNNDGAGHVFIVERIDDGNQIYTSESSYGGAKFYNVLRNNNNGRWGLGSGYIFRGCIVNPTIGKITTPEKSIDELAREVIAGKYGNGEARKKALGDKYREVQDRVNEILLGDNNSVVAYKKVINCYWLNLRTTPSFADNVYKVVKAGTKVEYLGMEAGWAKIKYDGKVLYCGNDYLN